MSVNEQLAEELHELVIKKFRRRKVYARFKDNILAAGLAEMGSLSSKNTMDITKFLRVSKKRDLSDHSDSEEQQKKAREGSLEENPEVENLFTTSMDSPE